MLNKGRVYHTYFYGEGDKPLERFQNVLPQVFYLSGSLENSLIRVTLLSKTIRTGRIVRNHLMNLPLLLYDKIVLKTNRLLYTYSMNHIHLNRS
jgi:hypothetical protein